MTIVSLPVAAATDGLWHLADTNQQELMGVVVERMEGLAVDVGMGAVVAAEADIVGIVK